MAFPTGWSLLSTTTIDNTKVSGSGDHSNFPVLIKDGNMPAEVYENIEADGKDLRFTTDEEGTTEVPFEIVSITPGSSLCQIWIKIPTLDYDDDTVFYIWGNNSGASAYARDDTYGSDNVWTDYALVTHMEGNSNDSTSNEMSGTDSGTAYSTSYGKIEQGVDLSGGTDEISYPDSSQFETTFTLSVWIKKSDGTDGAGEVVLSRNDSDAYNGIVLYLYGTADNAEASLNVKDGSSSLINIGGGDTTSLNDGDWHLMQFIIVSGGGADSSIYLLDGNIEETATCGAYSFNSQAFQVGDSLDTYWSNLDAELDELTYYKGARSSDFLKTEYANQNSPDTFMSSVGHQLPEVASVSPLVIELAMPEVTAISVYTGDFIDGLDNFLTDWSGVHTAFSENETNANTGTDTANGSNSSSYSQADTANFENFGTNTASAPEPNGDMDAYILTDAAMMLYIPPTLATGEYGLFHNGGGTNGQAGQIKSVLNGDTITLGITHNVAAGEDSTTFEITSGWHAVGFQFEDNSGNMALWIDGVNVSEAVRGTTMLVGSGNPLLGDSNADPVSGWSATTAIDGTGLVIANFVCDNPDNDNSSPAGNGDTFYTDFYDYHNNLTEQTASVSSVGLEITIPEVTPTYIQIETASTSPLTLELAIPEVTGTYVLVETATVYPLALQIYAPPITSEGIFTASITATGLTLTPTPVTATYINVDTASVTPISIEVSQPEVTATYTAIYSASTSPLSTELTIVPVTATSVSEFDASVSPVSILATINAITATYESELSASVSPLAMELDIPTVTATKREPEESNYFIITAYEKGMIVLEA